MSSLKSHTSLPVRQKTTLSQRGVELTKCFNVRELAGKIGTAKPWDAVTNPDGVVNIGTAENVCLIPSPSLHDRYAANTVANNHVV